MRCFPSLWDHRRAVSSLLWSERTSVAVLASWRTLAVCYLLATYIVAWIYADSPALFLAYLTDWGWTLSILYFGAAAAAGWTALHFFPAHAALTREQAGLGCLGSLCRAATALNGFALPLECLIVTLYWTVDFSPGNQDSPRKLWFNITGHGGNLLFLLADLLLGSFRPIDAFVFGLLPLGALYLAVNAAVTLTVQVLYPILTWRDATSAIVVCGAFLSFFVFFFLAAWIAYLRDAATQRCRQRAMLAVAQSVGSSGASVLLLDTAAEAATTAQYTDQGTLPCAQLCCCGDRRRRVMSGALDEWGVRTGPALRAAVSGSQQPAGSGGAKSVEYRFDEADEAQPFVLPPR